MKRAVTLVTSFVGSILLSACVTVEAPAPVQAPLPGAPYLTPDLAIMANENVHIVANDRSFRIRPGSRFTPPFFANLVKGSCQHFNTGVPDTALVRGYRGALQCGARPVTVYVKGREDMPLYGVLAIGRLHNGVTGPARTSYWIEIGEDQLEQAFSGAVTVSYEGYLVRGGAASNISAGGATQGSGVVSNLNTASRFVNTMSSNPTARRFANELGLDDETLDRVQTGSEIVETVTGIVGATQSAPAPIPAPTVVDERSWLLWLSATPLV